MLHESSVHTAVGQANWLHGLCIAFPPKKESRQHSVLLLRVGVYSDAFINPHMRCRDNVKVGHSGHRYNKSGRLYFRVWVQPPQRLVDHHQLAYRPRLSLYPIIDSELCFKDIIWLSGALGAHPHVKYELCSGRSTIKSD